MQSRKECRPRHLAEVTPQPCCVPQVGWWLASRAWGALGQCSHPPVSWGVFDTTAGPQPQCQAVSSVVTIENRPVPGRKSKFKASLDFTEFENSRSGRARPISNSQLHLAVFSPVPPLQQFVMTLCVVCSLDCEDVRYRERTRLGRCA